jgi:hypothetical protein
MRVISRWAVVAATFLAVLGGSIQQAAADVVVYATTSANGGSNSTLGILDLTTGQFTATVGLSKTFVSLTPASGGTFYGGAIGGGLYNITTSGTVTPFGSVAGHYWGLAHGAPGIYGANFSTTNLDKIASGGSSATPLGPLPSGISGSGVLTFGPNGNLYGDFVNPSSGALTLYQFDTSTGAATRIGSGLNTAFNDTLTLVSAGGTLYGIDTIQAEGFNPINIYTIDTTTGVATANGATVNGLPTGWTLDTAAAVPEPATLTMAAIGIVFGLGVACRRQRKTKVSGTFVTCGSVENGS